METVTDGHGFDGNSFEVALLPFALTAATADFWSKPRGANVVEVLTMCHQLGFLAFRRVLSRSLRLAACRTRYSSPLQLWVGSLARCGRLAFPVAVEVNLPKRKE